MKYLTLIRSIALLRQYQKPIKHATHGPKHLKFIEVEPEDIGIANRLAHEVLGRSLDELPPQTRRLVGLIDEMVSAACKRLVMERCDYRFTRRQVREHTGWGNTQLKVHLHRLEDLEYLLVHQGGRGQRFVYELLYEGKAQDGAARLPGLIDLEKLKVKRYDANKSGSFGDKSVPSRAQVGGVSGRSRGGKTDPKPNNGEDILDSNPTLSENAYIRDENSKNEPDSIRHSHSTHLSAADSAAEAS